MKINVLGTTKEHSIVPYTSTYIDSNGSEDVEYWEEVVS